jgi:hypothetical protein
MYRISETVRATHGQDGAVVLDIRQGRVVRLNVTGSFIFQCLQRGETESQIADGISQRFCISRDVAQADVGEFLNSMEQEGLVHTAAPTVRL